jgi:type II secretory pathway pseudopilin PulG
MELLTVMVIMGILFVLIIDGYTSLRAKAERAACQNNLRGLHVAASGYVTDHNSWPQIPTTDLKNPEYALAWIAAFKPYGLAPINWICPSVQHALGNMNYNVYPRLDYFGTPFDSSPRAPFLYPTHPWFTERGDMHGDGNLVVFANGSVRSLKEVVRETQNQTGPEW